MPPYSSPHRIRTRLFDALDAIGQFDDCVCLAYPHYFNVGDHLIWQGLLYWILAVKKSRVSYTASSFDFSEETLKRRSGKGPIFFRGGGNLGDLWPLYQRFREKVIAKNPDRKIVIMPQSIYFQDRIHLKQAQRIFNAHPDLTIFARDNQSFELGKRYFSRCRVLLGPDLCFGLSGLFASMRPADPEREVLYLCRHDKELDSRFTGLRLNSLKVTTEDWSVLTWKTRKFQALVRKFPKLWGFLAKNVYNGKITKETTEEFEPFLKLIERVDDPRRHLDSLYLVWLGVFQLRQYRLVITNRLHAHLLCVMLGVPHVFLPNTYYKNEAYYRAWTSKIPGCRFVRDPSQVLAAVDQLLSEAC